MDKNDGNLVARLGYLFNKGLLLDYILNFNLGNIMGKRFLIIVVLVIFLGIISTAGIMAFLEIKQGKAEGLQYAKNHDREACVRQVTVGKQVCTELSCYLENHYFFQTCMDNAKPSASLCENVPPIRNLFQFGSWKNKQCKKAKRTDRTCFNIWEKVRNTCKKEEDLMKSK